jgi:glycine C-acetyltransferase
MDLFEKCRSDGGNFGVFRVKDDHYFTRPVLDPEPGRVMRFQGKPCIQWSINNYLGLAENREIAEAAVDAARAYGVSAPMGSRMMTGNTGRHLGLERRLARHLDKEASALFSVGYMGVVGTISSLLDADDTILIDKMSHASMLDGTFLSKGKFRVFRHNDMNSLESHLRHVNRSRKGGVLIVTEGVFGMEGDLGKLDEICELKKKYDARLFVDDAHGFGVMGAHGKGTGSHFGVQDEIDVYFGTFSKAFAAAGGVSAADESVIRWITYNARTNVFTKSMPLVYVDAIDTALGIVQRDDWRRAKLFENARKLKAGLRELGYEVGGGASPITPVYVPAGDLGVGTRLVASLRERGIFVTGVTYPVVPKGILLFRMIPTASHTDEDIDRTVRAFRHVRDFHGLNLDGALRACA